MGVRRKDRPCLQDLHLTNDFLFCKTMQDKEVLIAFLAEILPNEHIRDLNYLSIQETIDPKYDQKSVVLDVCAKDQNGTIYNIEMQNENKKIFKRLRYYQSVIDVDELLKGQPYGALPKRYIIMLCDFDLLKNNRYIYTVVSKCLETNTKIQDGTMEILVNINGKIGKISRALKEFLAYVRHTRPIVSDGCKSKLVQLASKRVYHVKNDGRIKEEYMGLYMRDDDMREEGKIEGIGLALKIQKLFKKGLTIRDICKKMGIKEEEVKEIVAVLQ